MILTNSDFKAVEGEKAEWTFPIASHRNTNNDWNHRPGLLVLRLIDCRLYHLDERLLLLNHSLFLPGNGIV